MNIALHYAKFLINSNQELIARTAIKDCHCIGLNSFIINEKPRIRLYTADENCELYGARFDNPVIPIHSHKYDDIFTPISGKLIHHIWDWHSNNKYHGLTFNKYKYYRLSDDETDIEHTGSELLVYRYNDSDITFLPAKTLHSVGIKGSNVCWMITETDPVEEGKFEQIGYHQELKMRDELYKELKNPFDYLNDFFSRINPV